MKHVEQILIYKLFSVPLRATSKRTLKDSVQSRGKRARLDKVGHKPTFVWVENVEESEAPSNRPEIVDETMLLEPDPIECNILSPAYSPILPAIATKGPSKPSSTVTSKTVDQVAVPPPADKFIFETEFRGKPESI